MLLPQRPLLVQLVRELRLPAIYPYRELAEAGGLMSYSSDLKYVLLRQAGQIAEILRGANPGDIPYSLAERFELDLVALTRGPHGALLWRQGEISDAPGLPVVVRDTVGAGDTFNAGAMVALHRAGALTKAALGALSPDHIRAALDLGIAAAAITVSRPGANPPWAAELV